MFSNSAYKQFLSLEEVFVFLVRKPFKGIVLCILLYPPPTLRLFFNALEIISFFLYLEIFFSLYILRKRFYRLVIQFTCICTRSVVVFFLIHGCLLSKIK